MHSNIIPINMRSKQIQMWITMSLFSIYSIARFPFAYIEWQLQYKCNFFVINSSWNGFIHIQMISREPGTYISWRPVSKLCCNNSADWDLQQAAENGWCSKATKNAKVRDYLLGPTDNSRGESFAKLSMIHRKYQVFMSRWLLAFFLNTG